jgi:hypothetical protein
MARRSRTALDKKKTAPLPEDIELGRIIRARKHEIPVEVSIDEL